MKFELENLDLEVAHLKSELKITVQSPVGGVKALTEALGQHLPLIQGAYDNCLYVREKGYQQFRALKGSHAGAENTLQTTDANEIVFSIPDEEAVLHKAFEVIFEHGVNEDPTIHVERVWGSRSKYLDDKNNANRYWNRPDAEELHGRSGTVPSRPRPR